MSHEITFEGAELASVSIRKAKNGNTYASGLIHLRDEKGKFEASLPFRSFDAVAELKPIEAQYFAPELLEAASGGDMHFDGEDAETRERTVAKATGRPRANISGWLRTSKGANGKWETVFMINNLSL
jgi:hypothetical protein